MSIDENEWILCSEQIPEKGKALYFGEIYENTISGIDEVFYYRGWLSWKDAPPTLVNGKQCYKWGAEVPDFWFSDRVDLTDASSSKFQNWKYCCSEKIPFERIYAWQYIKKL